MKNRILYVGLVLALIFAVGWANRAKDSHNVDEYTLTYDIMAVSTARVPIPVTCEKIIIKAAGANTGYMHVGTNIVTTVDGGFELDSGDEVMIDSYNAANSIYVISTVVDENIHYICFN